MESVELNPIPFYHIEAQYFLHATFFVKGNESNLFTCIGFSKSKELLIVGISEPEFESGKQKKTIRIFSFADVIFSSQ